jgi:hypothetical protein
MGYYYNNSYNSVDDGYWLIFTILLFLSPFIFLGLGIYELKRTAKYIVKTRLTVTTITPRPERHQSYRQYGKPTVSGTLAEQASVYYITVYDLIGTVPECNSIVRLLGYATNVPIGTSIDVFVQKDCANGGYAHLKSDTPSKTKGIIFIIVSAVIFCIFGYVAYRNKVRFRNPFKKST